jgi:hypothetical protein
VTAPSLAMVPLVDRYRAALRLAGEIDDVGMREALLAAALWPTPVTPWARPTVCLEAPDGQFMLDLEAAS